MAEAKPREEGTNTKKNTLASTIINSIKSVMSVYTETFRWRDAKWNEKENGFSYNITTIRKMICEIGSCRMQFMFVFAFALGEQTRASSIEGKKNGLAAHRSVARFPHWFHQIFAWQGKHLPETVERKVGINFKSVYVYRTRSGFYFIFLRNKIWQNAICHAYRMGDEHRTTNSFHRHILLVLNYERQRQNKSTLAQSQLERKRAIRRARRNSEWKEKVACARSAHQRRFCVQHENVSHDEMMGIFTL